LPRRGRDEWNDLNDWQVLAKTNPNLRHTRHPKQPTKLFSSESAAAGTSQTPRRSALCVVVVSAKFQQNQVTSQTVAVSLGPGVYTCSELGFAYSHGRIVSTRAPRLHLCSAALDVLHCLLPFVGTGDCWQRGGGALICGESKECH
jgi:hypothetical protein